MTEPFYYEAHVTIRPVKGELLGKFHAVCRNFRFHVATFTKDSAGPDSLICTGRSKSQDDLNERMLNVIHDLRDAGLTVTRYKLESTLLDSRIDDTTLPLGEASA